MPDSVLIPAPVSATQGRCSRTSSASVSILRSVEGFTFTTTVRVRFADTDAQGVAHNTSYLVWFEVARVEYLREFAGGYQALRDQGIEALVLESLVRYRIPARFDDELEIFVRVSRIGRTSVTFEFAAYKVPDDTLAVTAHQTLVYVDLEERKAAPVPSEYRATIAGFEGDDVEH